MPVGGADETTGAERPNDSDENESARPDRRTVVCPATLGLDGPAKGTKAVRIAASTKRVETKVSATPPPLSPCMLSGPTDGPLSLDRSFFLRLEYLRSHLFSRLKSAILAHHGADSVSRARLGPIDAAPAFVRRKWLNVRPQMPFGGEASEVLVAPGERHRCIRDPPPRRGSCRPFGSRPPRAFSFSAAGDVGSWLGSDSGRQRG